MSDQIQQIELQIQDAIDAVEKANALERLEKNKDFKTIISEGYFTEEAKRAVLLRASPNAYDPNVQKDIENVITSVGGLYQYFNKIYRFGDAAAQALENDKKTREELLAEELEEVE